MNRQFHNLPSPEQEGLKWKPYEQARQKIERIEERSREASMKARALEQRIREEERADVRKLAESILSGNADPAAPVSELEGLGAELREQRRLRDALEQAMPEAEEQLRQTAWEHKEEWTSQADEALAKGIEAERVAYQRARKIAEEARERRLYLEALAEWTRRVPQTFSPPADVSVRSAFDRLAADTNQAERLLHERQQNERRELEAEENARREREATGEGAA